MHGRGPAFLKQLRHIFAAFLLLLLTVAAGEAGEKSAIERVAVVLSERGGVYEEFADAFEAAMAEEGRPLRVIRLGAKPAEAELAGAEVALAVGTQAMRNLASGPPTVPVLNVLVPQLAYERLAAEAGRKRGGGMSSAIWLDQSPARLVRLFRQVLPNAQRVGVLLGPDSQLLLPALKAAAHRDRLELIVETLSSESPLMPALARLLPAVDGLLALPDSVVHNRETARTILLTTYRHQKPLVAFSQSYANAGAVAGVFSTPALAALQAAEVLRALPRGKLHLPPPQYPAYPSIAINRQVARSLGLDLPADALILKGVERATENER